jgi:hypothetical protein
MIKSPEIEASASVSDQHSTPPSNDKGTVVSPIRPQRPEAENAPSPRATTVTPAVPVMPENPQAALALIRRKMEMVVTEYTQGRINRAQFNAIYRRYSEQQSVISRLIERNPDNEAWKQVAAPGHTSFLREHFEARLLYYLVYRHNLFAPLMMGGKQQPNVDQIGAVLRSLWNMPNRPKVGLARKELGNGQWLVLALGEFAVTLTVFQLEPSATQINRVRDLHTDFERANRPALENGTRSLDRFVFPQRALAEKPG